MKALLCCERTKPYLFNQNIYEFYESKYITSTHKFHEKQDYLLNGKIVSECDFEVEEITYELYGDLDWQHDYLPTTNTMGICNLENASCLDRDEIENYLKDNKGYAIHIKNLHIFDKPKELSEYMTYDKSYDNMFGWAFEEKEKYKPITKAPQNMIVVWLYENGKWVMYILIPVSSEEMCRIANKEQTTLIRKKVLKEVIK